MLTVTGAQAPSAGEIHPARLSAGPPDNWTGTSAPTEGVVLIPDHVDPTNPRRVYDLGHRAERKYLYEAVLVDGTGADINRFIARSILVDLWDDLYLPRAVRCAWAATIEPLRPAEHEPPLTATARPAVTFSTTKTSRPTAERPRSPRPSTATYHDVVYGDSGCGF